MHLLRIVAPLLILSLCAVSSAPVNVVYAGSLVTPMERTIGPAFAHACACPYQGEGKGSVALAKMIVDGVRNPDVFISADSAILDGLLHSTTHRYITWYAVFGTARMVLGYSPRSRFAPLFARVAANQLPIEQLLAAPGLRIGRTDPKLDPKGYRTLLVMQLVAARAHDKRLGIILGAAENPQQIFPEENLLVRLEDGDLDVAFLYSTESQSRGIPALEFPASVNLGHPAFANAYRKASITLAGTVHRGAPIAYALTILSDAHNAQGAVRFAHFVLRGAGKDALLASGLSLIEPQIVGDRSAAYAAIK